MAARWVICCFAFVSYCAAMDFGIPVPSGTQNPNDTLVFVQTIWRHGDRTPTHTFPTDKTKKWERGWGELTIKGMQQHVVLGQRLQKRYNTDIKFLPNTYNSSKIYIRSTDVNRTILSAASNLVGFFKGKKNTDYPDIADWPQFYVPVPIHTAHVDYEHDHVGNPLRQCNRSTTIMNFIKDTPEAQKTANDSKALLDKLSTLSGLKLDIWNVWAVYDAWFIDKGNNKTLPSGFTDEIFNQTRDLNNVVDNYDYGIGLKSYKNFDINAELVKLRGGPILSSLIDHMNAKVYCADTPRDKWAKDKKALCNWISPLSYYAYSAHDVTIAGLFATFDFTETNFDEPGFPHYSAAVSVELWKTKQGAYYVKAFYWVPPVDPNIPPTDNDFRDLTAKISNCTSECPLEQFITRSKKYLVEDPDTLCANTTLFYTPDKNNNSFATTGNLLLIVASIVHYVINV